MKSLVPDSIKAVMNKIEVLDPVLQKILSHLAENYDYPAILLALQMDGCSRKTLKCQVVTGHQAIPIRS